MTTTQRLRWVALLCVSLNGCAALPILGLNVAAQGAKGLVAMTLGPLSDAQDESNPDRCALVASFSQRPRDPPDAAMTTAAAAHLTAVLVEG